VYSISRDPCGIFPIQTSLSKITYLIVLDEADDVRRRRKSIKKSKITKICTYLPNIKKYVKYI
jgi:hypothetical protein